jgi:glutamine synthetase
LEDKEVPIRVCIDAELGYPTNVEYKLCDASCNIYLALACILGCGVDGIAQHLKLRSILSEATVPAQGELCTDLRMALLCLQADTFLSDLLGEKLRKGYVAIKMAEIEHTKDLTLEQELSAIFR